MESLSLYLAPWQKRMVKDLMPPSALRGKSIRDITKVMIKNPRIKCPASYKIPIEGIRRGDWVMYLTDEQMVMVKEYLNLKTTISSINISPQFVKSGEIVFG